MRIKIEDFGYRNDYLYHYKTNHKLGHLTLEQVYEEFMSRKARQEKVMNDLQQMFYKLEENRKIASFGVFLIAKGLYSRVESLHALSRNVFKQTKHMKNDEILSKYEKIVSIYKDWECLTSC